MWKDNEPVDDEEYWDNSDSELNKNYSLFKLKCKKFKQNYLNSYSSQLLYAYISIWMNEFLEQLVRDLTNAYSRSQNCLVSVYHPAPQISEAFFVFLVAGGQMLWKQQPWSNWTVYALSLSLSACFLRTRFMLSSQGQGTISKRRGLVACVQTMTPTANFWAQIIFDPYRRPLTLTFLLVSTRGLFQDVISTVCITARYPRILQKF